MTTLSEEEVYIKQSLCRKIKTMYTLKLMNNKFQIYQEIPCQDIDTAKKIATDRKVRLYVISKLISDDPYWVREELVYSKKTEIDISSTVA